MSTYKAVVHGGRAVIENLEYADGTELELEVIGDEDFEADMAPDERGRLDAAIDRGLGQAAAGQTIPADEVVARLRARHG